MINNNTQKKTNVSTGVKTESEIYLKKSELPKNVSSFSNDAGYISKSALDTWLKNHNYIPKSEINTLISNANLVVVDSINKQYDEDAINRLNNYIKDIKGEIVAIKDRLASVESGFISIDKEGDFATSSQVQNLTIQVNNLSNEISHIDIDTSHLATKDEIPTKVSELINDKGYLTELPDLSKYAKKSDLSGYATQAWVEGKGYLTSHQDISHLAKLSDLSKYAQTASLKNYAKKTDIPSLDGYVKFDDIDGLLSDNVATKDWVESKGYLTSHQDVSKFAKKSDLNIYATQSWVEGKGYLTSHQDISQLAKTSDLSKYVQTSTLSNTLKNYVKKSDIDLSEFATKDEIPDVSVFATRVWVSEQGYLDSSALRNYAKKSDIPDVSGLASIADIPSLDGYATQSWVEEKGYLTEHQSLKNYAKKSDIPDVSEFITRDEVPSFEGLASKDWVNSQGYLTEHQSLKNYAKKTDIPSLDGYATEDWVNSQGFLKQTNMSDYAKLSDLSDYVTRTALNNKLNGYVQRGTIYEKSDIDNIFLSKEDASRIYASKNELNNNYLTRTEAAQQYLEIEDYRGLKDATVISEAYATEPFSEFAKDLDVLQNGFYIVQGHDVVIVKNHQPISIFENGALVRELEWREE